MPGWKLTSRHVMTTAWQGPASPQSRLSAFARCFRILVLRRHKDEHLTCQWRRCRPRTRGIESVLGAGKAADLHARLYALHLNEGRQYCTKHLFSSQTLKVDKSTVELMFPQHFARIKLIVPPWRWRSERHGRRWTQQFQFTCAGTKLKKSNHIAASIG